MKTTTMLLTQLKYTYKSISLNLGDISENEAITWPPSGGNCINWVIGHILYSREKMQELLNLSPVAVEELQVYRRGVNPKNLQSEFLSLSILKKQLRDSQNAISGELENAALPEETSEEIASLIFHEAYHAGQIGLLRRVLGKKGQIV